jgi:hypothetical protein
LVTAAVLQGKPAMHVGQCKLTYCTRPTAAGGLGMFVGDVLLLLSQQAGQAAER